MTTLQPAVLDALGEINWEYEEYDVSHDIILQFISRFASYDLDLHVLTTSEFKKKSGEFIEGLKPLDKGKLLKAMRLSEAARKDCDIKLNSLRKDLRRVVCISAELQGKLKASKNLLFAGNTMINIRLLERYVAWYNKRQQHDTIIDHLLYLLTTYEPEILLPDDRRAASSEDRAKKHFITDAKENGIIKNKSNDVSVIQIIKRLLVTEFKDKVKPGHTVNGTVRGKLAERLEKDYGIRLDDKMIRAYLSKLEYTKQRPHSSDDEYGYIRRKGIHNTEIE